MKMDEYINVKEIEDRRGLTFSASINFTYESTIDPNKLYGKNGSKLAEYAMQNVATALKRELIGNLAEPVIETINYLRSLSFSDTQKKEEILDKLEVLKKQIERVEPNT